MSACEAPFFGSAGSLRQSLPNENGAAPGSEDGAVKRDDRSGYFAEAYNAPTLFQSITFQTALRYEARRFWFLR